ncbi:MAG TPA: diguanylate cyclase [Thermoanaerobaculia bacterium]|jgi:diguanylate cyclase (GGDEF)-like protein
MNDPPDRRQDEAAEPLRILLVDDDTNYRAYVAALTRRLGFWVDTADDGQAGLDRLAHGTYDMVVIDHEMPRLTGIETVGRLRANEATQALYAVMLTSREDVDTKLTALDAGFDDFLTKTSSEREIVAKLTAGRRLAARQRTMDLAIRDLYGLATRDDLTGAFNRRFFISEAERLLAEGVVVNVVLLDLDGFKHVNDTYGHLTGDQVLRDVATALHTHTRVEDVVARFGGDEFVIAVPRLDVPVLERICERLSSAVAEIEWSAGGTTFSVGISAGIASSRLLEAPTLVQLMTAADRDMYKNKWLRKHPGRGPEVYEYPSSDRNVVERLFRNG